MVQYAAATPPTVPTWWIRPRRDNGRTAIASAFLRRGERRVEGQRPRLRPGLPEAGQPVLGDAAQFGQCFAALCRFDRGLQVPKDPAAQACPTPDFVRLQRVRQVPSE